MAVGIEEALADSDFEVRLGESTLVGHALDHSPADILRELVQNEYDAGGTSIEVSFGSESLVVTGDGKGIDAKGWNRLTVILGAGAVLGTDERVDPKLNSIGSKNVGLKSLFLFGDQIFISSNGRQTVLDRARGSLKMARKDYASKGVRGVRIEVPYRRVSTALPAFDQGQEALAMTSIVDELASTLVKLSRPKGDNLKKVVVRSERLDHELRWSQ